MGLSPPSESMMSDRVILRFARGRRGETDPYTDHGPAGVLPANVSAPETVPGSISDQGVAVLRCLVMVLTNPILTDSGGKTRKLRKDDGVVWQGDLWIASGPMSPEARDDDGVPVCWRFEMERVA